jgi:heme-degrading monooxygenase HmoA
VTKPIICLRQGTTRAGQSDQFLDYILETGARDIQATRGNLGLVLLRSKEGGNVHFWTLSPWEGMESTKAFAGGTPERPRYYRRDTAYLLELEPRVLHEGVRLRAVVGSEVVPRPLLV